MEEINHSNIQSANSDRSLERLEHAASWHYPKFLWRVLPTGIKDAMRNLRERMLARYLTRHLPRHKEFEQSLADADASARISIVVPVHDSPQVIGRCFISLEKYAPQAEIILVDDASNLEETRQILASFSTRNNWKLIRNSKALGHSGACGAGACLATRPFLCLLNSDTVVTPWCWRPIVQAFDDNPKIGVAGPSTSNSGNLQTHHLAFQTRLYLNDSQICEYASHLLGDDSKETLTAMPWVSGFALFIRRSLWEHLDGFDRNLPDYANDVELCKRVLAAGYRVVWVRDSYIHHIAGVSYCNTIGLETRDTRIRVAGEYVKQKHGLSDL